MPSLPFTKAHGLGNDFILLFVPNADEEERRLVNTDLAVNLCDRHRGIGADGVILILAPHQSEADARMVVLNADGSRPEMCGNGIRCVAKLVHDRLPSIRGKDRIAVETDAGLLHCDLIKDPSGYVDQVKVAMGAPNLQRERLPMTGSGPFVDQSIEVAGQKITATAVSMGNPHLVSFVTESTNPKVLAETLGPQLERHEWFPQRTNVEFAKIKGQETELWVWERGCGITQACGTGACATAAAAVATKRLPASYPLAIRLPGGVLTIEVDADLTQAYMTGPATVVFDGTISL